MEFLWFILIGLAAGWLAGQLMKGGGFGLVGDIVVGVIGALLGGFLFSTFGVSAGGGLIVSVRASTHSGGRMTAGESPYISRWASRDAAAANRCLWLS